MQQESDGQTFGIILMKRHWPYAGSAEVGHEPRAGREHRRPVPRGGEGSRAHQQGQDGGEARGEADEGAAVFGGEGRGGGSAKSCARPCIRWTAGGMLRHRPRGRRGRWRAGYPRGGSPTA